MEEPTCGFDKPNPVPTSPQSFTIYPALPKTLGSHDRCSPDHLPQGRRCPSRVSLSHGLREDKMGQR